MKTLSYKKAEPPCERDKTTIPVEKMGTRILVDVVWGKQGRLEDGYKTKFARGSGFNCSLGGLRGGLDTLSTVGGSGISVK
jgi:hypothetical protein